MDDYTQGLGDYGAAGSSSTGWQSWIQQAGNTVIGVAAQKQAVKNQQQLQLLGINNGAAYVEGQPGTVSVNGSMDMKTLLVIGAGLVLAFVVLRKVL